MLYKKKSAHYKLSKYLLVIPILFFLCVLYSFKNNSQGTKPIVSVSTGITTAVVDFISGVTEGCEGCDETFTTITEWNGEKSILVEKTLNGEVVTFEKEDDKISKINKDIAKSVSMFKELDMESISDEYLILRQKYKEDRNYIANEFVYFAQFFSILLEIEEYGEDRFKICGHFNRDLSLLIQNRDTNVLEVGETYQFKVLNVTDNDFNLSINPAKGSFKTSEILKGENGQYSFSFSPEHITKNDKLMTLQVKSGDETAETSFKIIDSLKINPQLTEEKKVEYIYLHNGDVIDAVEPDSFIKADTIRIYNNGDEIREVFGIKAKGKHLVNFIGNLNITKGDTGAKLYQNIPNPFVETTSISFDLEEAVDASITIVNVQGEKIKNYSGNFKKGKNEIIVKGEDLPGFGVYYYSLEADGFRGTMKLVYSENQKEIDKRNNRLKHQPQNNEVHVAATSFLPTKVKNPMIIIDGKISESKNAHYFTQSRIKSTKALTKEESISKYGDRSQDGALEVVMHSEEDRVTTASKSGEDIFKIVEEMPRYPGCEVEGWTKEQKYKCAQENLIVWIYENLKYTDEAVKNKVEGKVYAQFIVEKDGAISNINVVRDIGYGCGDQVKKLLSVMPKWIPGKQRGIPVRVLFTLPVKFMIDSDEGSVKPIGISRSTFDSDCDDPVTILDGRLVESLDIEPDQIKEITVYKQDVPEKYIQYKNHCGIIEVISKNPENHKGTSDSSSKKLKVTNLTKELLPPNPPSDFDLLPPPPPPPPSPDQAVLDLLEECENPVLIVNGDRQPFSVFNTLDRRNFTGMKISSETFPMMEYRQGDDCGVIELNTKNKVQTAKTINDLLLKSKDNKNGLNGNTLNQNEPNPFYDKTTVGFSITDEQLVVFEIYDVSGKVVKKFEEQSYPKGYNEIEIERSDLSGGGVYYISMRSGDFFATKKIIYVEGRD